MSNFNYIHFDNKNNKSWSDDDLWDYEPMEKKILFFLKYNNKIQGIVLNFSYHIIDNKQVKIKNIKPYLVYLPQDLFIISSIYYYMHDTELRQKERFYFTIVDKKLYFLSESNQSINYDLKINDIDKYNHERERIEPGFQFFLEDDQLYLKVFTKQWKKLYKL